MAYVPTRTTYKLVFEDPEYAGLEVHAKAGSVGDYLEMNKLANADFTPPLGEDALDPVIDLFKTFAGDPDDPGRPGVLASWNVEEPAGHPVPATWQGLRSLELMFAMAIINAWMDAVAGALPLDGGDLAETLPMEVSP